jgi:carboxymethylenebutenolidase
MDKLKMLAGTTAVSGLMLQLENNYAHADIIPVTDSRLTAADTEIGPGLKGYLVYPKEGPGKLPAVIVIHENRGLNPHIKDVTRRLALEGFLAFGVDYLAGMGGTPTDEDKAREMIGQLKPDEVIKRSQAVVAALHTHERSNGKAGAVGFCWGGGQVNALAVADPNLAAGVAYYGSQPKTGIENIKAPLLLHYAGLDDRINAGITDYEAALKANSKVFELYMYDSANHAFNNDTNAARYNRAAADLAWERSVGFLKKYCS